MRKTASDGKVFRVLETANGHEVVTEDANGFCRSDGGSEWWDQKRCAEELAEAIDRYEAELASGPGPGAKFYVINPVNGEEIYFEKKADALYEGWQEKDVRPL